MKKTIFFITFALAVALTRTDAATVDEVVVWSVAMATGLPVRVILPEGYAQSLNRYPSVYLLHGAGGSCRVMSDVLEQGLCDEFNMIGIVPDGTKASWWWDSPTEPNMRFETFVAKEVRTWVDHTYRTIPRRDKRAIIGESMGGHGACWIGFRHRDIFGAVGNIYGGVDVRPFEGKWSLEKRLGPQGENPERWLEHSVLTEAAKLRNGDIELLTVVGTDDIFLVPNRRMHELLAANRVRHFYLEVRGEDEALSSHTHPFRKAAEPVMFRFADRYFREGKGYL